MFRNNYFIKPMKLFYVLLFITLPHLVVAQVDEQKNIDAMLARLSKKTDASDRINLLDSIAFSYKTVNPDLGIKYAREELELAVKINWKTGIAMANASLGFNYQYKSDYPEALEYFYVALGMNEKNGNQYNIGSNSNNIGSIYQAQNNLPKALEFYFKALKIDQDVHNLSGEGGDMGNIGTVYMSQKKYPEALQYDLQSLAIFRKVGDSDGVAHNLGNIGNVYNEMGSFNEALNYDMQALSIFQAEGDKGGVALNLGNIGTVYAYIARDSVKGNKHGDLIAADKKACLEKSVEYLEKSIAISKELGQFDDIMEFSHTLSETYSLLGDYKSALESYKQYTAAKDSVFSSEDKLKIAQLGIQREVEVRNKQAQIDQLGVIRKRYRDEVYLLFIAIALLLLGIVFKKIFPRML